MSEADLVCRDDYPTVRSHHLAAMIGEAVAEHHHHWKGRAGGLTAEDLVRTDVVSCAPAEAVGIVVRRMIRHDVRTLPVLEDGRLVGVLNRHDILPLFDRPDVEIRAEVTELPASPLRTPQGHAVQSVDGVVILTGSALHPTDQRVVCSLVGQVPGVIEVVDRLTWREPEPKPAYARETRR